MAAGITTAPTLSQLSPADGGRPEASYSYLSTGKKFKVRKVNVEELREIINSGLEGDCKDWIGRRRLVSL